MSEGKILLIGSSGQVGNSIESLIQDKYELVTLNRPVLDFTKPKKLKSLILKISPSIVINAAGYTSVDLAESEPDLAYICNQDAPRFLAKICAKENMLLIHFSTDYVFDGNKKEAYLEKDVCNPINVYGLSKRQGEIEILKSGCKYFIFRTSWVYGPVRNNFLKTILELASMERSINVVDDQIGLPTSTELISLIVEKCIDLYFIKDIKESDYGIYHLAPFGKVSWYGFACAIIKTATKEGFEIKIKEKDIKRISSKEYSFVAKRPINSVLNISKLDNFLGIRILNWEKYLNKVLKQIRMGSV